MKRFISSQDITILFGGLFFLQAGFPEAVIPSIIRRLLVIAVCFVLLARKNSWYLFVNKHTSPYLLLVGYYTAVLVSSGIFSFFIQVYGRLRVFPFFVLGYAIARGKNGEKQTQSLLIFALIGQGLGCLYRLPFYLSGSDRKLIVEASQFSEGNIETDSFVRGAKAASELQRIILFFFDKRYFYSLLSVLIISVCLILVIRSMRLKFLVLGLSGICILTILAGKMTAPLLALMISFSLLVVLLGKPLVRETQSIILKINPIVGSILIACVLIFLIFLGRGTDWNLLIETITSGEGFDKIEVLLENLGENPIEAFNEASNGRLDKISFSLNAFFESPIFGVLNGGNLGNHSAVFDFLGQFGIVGNLPIVYLFGQWIYNSYFLLRHPKFKPYGAGFLTIFIVTIIGSLFDRLFIGTAGFDEYILLSAGISAGLVYSAKKMKAQQRGEYFAVIENRVV